MNGKFQVMTRGYFIKKIGRKAPAFMKKIGWNSGWDKKAKKEPINIISDFAELPLN